MATVMIWTKHCGYESLQWGIIAWTRQRTLSCIVNRDHGNHHIQLCGLSSLNVSANDPVQLHCTITMR